MTGACRPMPSQSANSVSTPRVGSARAAPETMTATSLPRPVWPISHADGKGDDRRRCTSTIAEITRCWPMRSGMLPTPVQFAGSRIQAMPSRKRFMRHPPARPVRPSGARALALGRDHGMSSRPISTHRPVEGEREQDRRHDAGEDLGLDAALEPVGEEAAEALDADDRTDRREADRAHDHDADARRAAPDRRAAARRPRTAATVEYPTAVADWLHVGFDRVERVGGGARR